MKTSRWKRPNFIKSVFKYKCTLSVISDQANPEGCVQRHQRCFLGIVTSRVFERDMSVKTEIEAIVFQLRFTHNKNMFGNMEVVPNELSQLWF